MPAQKPNQNYYFEPIMAAEVVTPEEYSMGDIIGDFNRRRGKRINWKKDWNDFHLQCRGEKHPMHCY